jgi:TM2 domain-containing membrane protein YozV
MENGCSQKETDQSHAAIEYQRPWSPATAAFLSFLFPGWGQLYKGQVIVGLIWLVVTIAGFLFMTLLGIFLNICCILEAAFRKTGK